MRVLMYERAFVGLGAGVLAACLAALLYASAGMGIHLAGGSGRLDPRRARATPPFDRLGVRQTGPNRYEAVVVGQMWAFNPPTLRVPAGAEVTFVATTLDVVHGFYVAGTRLNLMLVPGQVSRITYRFLAPGEHLLICHEYCGIGHHTMAGRVIVEPRRTAAAPATAAPTP